MNDMTNNLTIEPMPIPPHKAPYTKTEDLINALSHGVGVIFGIVALILMVQLALEQSQLQSLKLFSAIIYGTSIILLFLTSTLYHSFNKPELKKVLKILDHCAIYLLIAGTNTPFFY